METYLIKNNFSINHIKNMDQAEFLARVAILQKLELGKEFNISKFIVIEDYFKGYPKEEAEYLKKKAKQYIDAEGMSIAEANKIANINKRE